MNNATQSAFADARESTSSRFRIDTTLKRLAKNFLSKATRTQLRRIRYQGTKYYCNICDSHVRTMFVTGLSHPVLAELDVVGGERLENDTCPVCFCNSRARLMFNYIDKELGVLNSLSRVAVMHVAPEYGIQSRLTCINTIDYLGVDLNPIQERGMAEIDRCDITAINYPDDRFDLIICSHVLEHIPDDRLAMRELFRVLKPGGTAILQTPISASLQQTIEDPYIADATEQERRFGQYDHVRIYGADYTSRLTEAGFRVEIFEPRKVWGEEAVEKLRLNPRERLFAGRK